MSVDFVWGLFIGVCIGFIIAMILPCSDDLEYDDLDELETEED